MRQGTRESRAAESSQQRVDYNDAMEKASQDCKEIMLSNLVQMIQSGNHSTDNIVKKFQNFAIREIEMLVEYMNKHPGFKLDDLIETLRDFNGFGLVETFSD